MGLKVTILCWDRDDNYALRKETLNLEEGDIPIYRIGIQAKYGNGIKTLPSLLRFQLCIRKFIKNNTFDVIHACDFDTALTSYFGRRKKTTKFVYDIFDFYVESMRVPKLVRPIIFGLDKHIINGADATIICTEERRRQISGTEPKRLYVIHNSPPVIENMGATEAHDKVRIAYFGIFSRNGRMIPELLEVVSKHKDWELHIGGFGAIEEDVKHYGAIHENIKYYGRVSYKTVLEVENNSDILTAIYDPAVPNHKYAAPNKFYEALMLGKPLIMIKNTGMSDIVQDNGIGAVIDYTKEDLEAAIAQLIDRKDEWSDISKKMKQLYSEHYSWDTMKDRIENLYKTIIV